MVPFHVPEGWVTELGWICLYIWDTSFGKIQKDISNHMNHGIEQGGSEARISSWTGFNHGRY